MHKIANDEWINHLRAVCSGQPDPEWDQKEADYEKDILSPPKNTEE